MSYRGPNKQRISQQVRDAQMPHVGETATWRRFVSAGTGIPEFNLPDTDYWTERTITALFRATIGMAIQQPEYQTIAGQITVGEFIVVSQEKLLANDELRWRGSSYRIESDSVPSRMDSSYMNVLKRGQ